MHDAGGGSSHGGTVDIHRTTGSLLTLLDFRHRTETMQARVVTQLNIGQSRFDAEQRPEQIIPVLFELSFGLFEAFEFEIERFFFRDLLWCAVLEAAEVLFSGDLPFCYHCVSVWSETCC